MVKCEYVKTLVGNWRMGLVGCEGFQGLIALTVSLERKSHFFVYLFRMLQLTLLQLTSKFVFRPTNKNSS